MRVDQIETFEIMEYLIVVDIFLKISDRTGNLMSRQISKNRSNNQLEFFANSVIYFWNKLSNQISNSNGEKKLSLNWMVSEKNISKRI